MGNYVCGWCRHWPHPTGLCEVQEKLQLKPCGCDDYYPYFNRYLQEPEMPVFCGFPCLDFFDKLAGPDLVHLSPDQSRLEEMVGLQGPFCWGCAFEYGKLPKDRVLGRWGLPQVDAQTIIDAYENLQPNNTPDGRKESDMSKVKGKGKYGISTNNNTPKAGQEFDIMFRNFKADSPSIKGQVWFGLGYGYASFVVRKDEVEHGKGKITCVLPQFDPRNGRDLVLGAVAKIYEYISDPETGGFGSEERGILVFYVGAEEDSE